MYPCRPPNEPVVLADPGGVPVPHPVLCYRPLPPGRILPHAPEVLTLAVPVPHGGGC